MFLRCVAWSVRIHSKPFQPKQPRSTPQRTKSFSRSCYNPFMPLTAQLLPYETTVAATMVGPHTHRLTPLCEGGVRLSRV